VVATEQAANARTAFSRDRDGKFAMRISLNQQSVKCCGIAERSTLRSPEVRPKVTIQPLISVTEMDEIVGERFVLFTSGDLAWTTTITAGDES
jgi:hypothetical protein